VSREVSPETVRPKEKEESEEHQARMRKTEAVPSAKEVDEHNVDHAIFRSWCPHCVKGRGEAYGHPRGATPEKEIPTISIDYAYVRPFEESEEEK